MSGPEAHRPGVPRFGDRRWDIVVVGSGSAGSSAAIAAARHGAAVLLLEKLPFLGGTSTAVLDTFYGFYTPGSAARKVVGGVADDVVAGLRALGPVIERANTYGAGTGVTYHPDHLKVVWERLVTEAGATVLLHAFVQDAEVRDGHVSALLVATKAGLQRVEGAAFVDASGDADLCHFAGFGYETAGEREPAQTLTTTFRVANVDLERRRAVPKAEINARMAEAAASGAYDLPRREGSDHITPVEGMTATVMTRLDSYRRDDGTTINATDPSFLSDAEIRGRRQALEYVRFLVDRVPGYEQARLATFGVQIGVRETRRVEGDYRLTQGRRPRRAAVRRQHRAVRRADRGPPWLAPTRTGSTCRTARPWRSRTGPSSCAMPRTCSSPAAASARPTTRTRPCARWRSAWRSARQPARRPRSPARPGRRHATCLSRRSRPRSSTTGRSCTRSAPWSA